MRTTLSWSDKVPERDGVTSVCHSVCFSPDGSQLLAAVGNRVLVYDASDGDIIKSLKGHKAAVYCVCYASNGERFASGGADCMVVIWTSTAEGILKYSHNDSIQALGYNPVTHQLASATANDIGLWSAEQKTVAKHRVLSKVLCLAWTASGQYLALGHFNGDVSILDKVGNQKVSIHRGAPVWSLAWNPLKDEATDVLAVGCWDGTLSFYQLNGNQAGEDLALEYDPCTVSYHSNGTYTLVGGTNRQLHLATKSGKKLCKIADTDSWIWSAASRPGHNYVAVGCQDGTIAVYQLLFSTVHGLYQERYAYRENMTDVIVQHLTSDQKIKIRCQDYVKKIAVYKDRLAVQLPDRVLIYEPSHEDAHDMQYRMSCTIQKRLECNLLVVTSLHVILCQEKKLLMLTFTGVKEREWVLESVIRYIKIVGGPVGREGLLVGLKNGSILKIYIDNGFPIPLIKHHTAIRCLDISSSRTKLSIVDENAAVLVYDIKSKKLLFEDSNANSVAWNTDLEDMLCFSGNGMLSIKTGGFPLHRQKLQGFVVGFQGSKIFCLHYICMQTIDVPQSESLYRYMANRDYEKAFKVACLGVTQTDWRLLAMESLKAMRLEIARKAFIQVRDVKYIDLINRIEAGRRMKEDERLYMAEIMAFQGRYQDAARLFARAGYTAKAMEMFGDLRQFDEAKQWAESFSVAPAAAAPGAGPDAAGTDAAAPGAGPPAGADANVQQLMRRQAEWSEEVRDYGAAADMYLKAQNHEKAIALLAKGRKTEKLSELVRSLPKSEPALLRLCAEHLVRFEDVRGAIEAYQKVGDFRTLARLYVDNQRWSDAFALMKAHPGLADVVYVPHAEWLVDQDRFDEARVAYARAGKPEESSRMLKQLTQNAVMERRYEDAAHYFWLLSMEHLSYVRAASRAEMGAAEAHHLRQYEEFRHYSELYHAYEFVRKAIDEPFHSIHGDIIFNAARFLVMRMASRQRRLAARAPGDEAASAAEYPAPVGISMVYIYYALARYSEQLGAYKLARHAYNQLLGMRVPTELEQKTDLSSLTVRCRPFSDREEILPVCYRCSTVNPLINSAGDACIARCGDFQRSFLTFEHLPLVQFTLPPDISDEEAERMILSDGGAARRAAGGNGGGDQQYNVLTLDAGGGGGEDGGVDAIWARHASDSHHGSSRVVASRELLEALHHSEVVVRRSPCKVIPNEYFRIVDAVPIIVGACGNFFEMEDYEMHCLESGSAPIARTTLDSLGDAGGGSAWELTDAIARGVSESVSRTGVSNSSSAMLRTYAS